MFVNIDEYLSVDRFFLFFSFSFLFIQSIKNDHSSKTYINEVKLQVDHCISIRLQSYRYITVNMGNKKSKAVSTQLTDQRSLMQKKPFSFLDFNVFDLELRLLLSNTNYSEHGELISSLFFFFLIFCHPNLFFCLEIREWHAV